MQTLSLRALTTPGYFEDYNNSTGDQSLPANTWVQLSNDGQGAFTNTTYSPAGSQPLVDVATGKIDPTGLHLGDSILIRNDFTVTPTINNALLELRYSLGAGENAYTLPKRLLRLNRGAGVADRIVDGVDLIYMGDENTRANPIAIEIRCSADAVVNNAGSAIVVLLREAV